MALLLYASKQSCFSTLPEVFPINVIGLYSNAIVYSLVLITQSCMFVLFLTSFPVHFVEMTGSIGGGAGGGVCIFITCCICFCLCIGYGTKKRKRHSTTHTQITYVPAAPTVHVISQTTVQQPQRPLYPQVSGGTLPPPCTSAGGIFPPGPAYPTTVGGHGPLPPPYTPGYTAPGGTLPAGYPPQQSYPTKAAGYS